jgi:hypothetical protein
MQNNVYGSKNLKDQLLQISKKLAHGGVWECPDFSDADIPWMICC